MITHSKHSLYACVYANILLKKNLSKSHGDFKSHMNTLRRKLRDELGADFVERSALLRGTFFFRDLCLFIYIGEVDMGADFV